MNMTGETEKIKRELRDMVQSLRSHIELDIERGRFLSYLRMEGSLEGEEKPPVSVETDRVFAKKPETACEERELSVNRRNGSHAMEKVQKELGDCQRCSLGHGRTNLVFGEGSPDASLVFVGEAPGADEDAQGRPFVGRAGQLLTKIISAMGLSRKDVYICNILKCRPPGNRNPKPDEICACEPFLVKQLQAIQPEVICALGTFASQTLLKKEVPITTLRGRFHSYEGIKVMPTYHPAYLLRNEGAKKLVWEDIRMVMKMLGIEKKEV
jgi:uracil-DNA glycosylase family 4